MAKRKRLAAKRITSWQKKKTIMAKRITSRQKEKPQPHGIDESMGAGESFPGAQ